MNEASPKIYDEGYTIEHFAPIGPSPQHFQATRFFRSPNFGQSSLKGHIYLHGHKIVNYARNMLESLYQVGRKNMRICVWL